jgi:2-polyprenyl-6-methoxyphenol hydroxylase-like FAD-dependent oxidoreductase
MPLHLGPKKEPFLVCADENRKVIPVLIAGGGPVGLSTAVDLGRRGIACVLVEQEDGTIYHPRATALNARTMEFFRRWGIADAVREAGVPQDFPHTVLYLTSLTGFLVARIDRPGHGMGKSSAISPERPQRCNQIWLDPILRELAASFPSVTMRYRCKLDAFGETTDGIVATLYDRDSGAHERLAARYLIDCSGGQSQIREQLGIAMDGDPALDYNVSIFLRIPELWSHHDKGKASLHSFVDPSGVSRTLIGLDGRELWRLGLRGKQFFDNVRELDVDALVTQMAGKRIPYELISVRRWVAHDQVAERFRAGRVFLAGDAAHLNSPSGGFGLNTGMGDVVDLGWKLSAVLQGWAPEALLETYDVERRPVATRNVRQATENYQSSRNKRPPAEIADATTAGDRARREWGDRVLREESRTYITNGIALGYSYASPIIVDDGSPPPPSAISEYHPTSRPGARAPHAWITPERSTLDLFGDTFVLLRFGADAPAASVVEAAFAQRGVPLHAHTIVEPQVARLYERRFVLVRPDGHVAWRSDALPKDPLELADCVRGAYAGPVATSES